MSIPDAFALGGFVEDDAPRRNERAALRAALEANPRVIEAADRLVRAVLRAMPDYDVEKSFLADWPDGKAGVEGGAV